MRFISPLYGSVFSKFIVVQVSALAHLYSKLPTELVLPTMIAIPADGIGVQMSLESGLESEI